MHIARRLRLERPADGLSSNKLAILAQLHRGGPATAREVADALHQLPQSLTRLLAELAEAKLIAREPGLQDRREVILTLTTPGLLALARDMAARDAWLEAALARLPPLERDLLLLAAPVLERLAALATEPTPEPENEESSP